MEAENNETKRIKIIFKCQINKLKSLLTKGDKKRPSRNERQRKLIRNLLKQIHYQIDEMKQIEKNKKCRQSRTFLQNKKRLKKQKDQQEYLQHPIISINILILSKPNSISLLYQLLQKRKQNQNKYQNFRIKGLLQKNKYRIAAIYDKMEIEKYTWKNIINYPNLLFRRQLLRS